MNPTGPRSSESKARNDLLALKKVLLFDYRNWQRKPKEPGIKILSIEETRAIEKEEEENKPKRKKLITTDRTMEDGTFCFSELMRTRTFGEEVGKGEKGCPWYSRISSLC